MVFMTEIMAIHSSLSLASMCGVMVSQGNVLANKVAYFN